MSERGMRRGERALLLASFLATCVVLWATQTPASAEDRELPCRFYYFKEPIDLELDTGQVAVQYRAKLSTAQASRVSANAGLQIAQYKSTGIPRWKKLGLATRAGDAVSLDQRIAAVAGSPDVEFASPVFYRASGRWVIVTRDILLCFTAEHADHGEALLAELAPGLEVVAADFAGMPGAYHLRSTLRNGFDVLALANRIAQDPRVAWAEPDFQTHVTVDFSPNDPYFTNGDLWGIHNYGQDGGTADMDMDGPEAWDSTTGSASIRVLILDSGVQQDHPDLNQAPGNDFTSEGGDGGPHYSSERHGTTVAGCVSAIINNGIGVVGIAPDCKVLSARFSIENSFYISWLTSAIDWGVSQGARCSVSSWSMDPDSTVTTKFNSTRSQGMVHFAAAGNYGAEPIGYPATLASVNAIGGINRYGGRYGSYGSDLAFTGPAVDIWTTDRTGSAGYCGGDYCEVEGTSFSCPYAAGVAALALSLDPSLTPAEVEAKMQAAAKDLGAPGFDTQFGWGLVNANFGDCNNNGVPDICDTDCTATIPGSGSLCSVEYPLDCGDSDDCQPDGMPDECQLTDNDCNANNVPDDCDAAALIDVHPANTSGCAGETLGFEVVSPNGSATYQWYHDYEIVPGETDPGLVVSGATTDDEGEYWCVVTFGCIDAQSDSATLTLIPPPADGALSNRSACEGGATTFTATFTGVVEAHAWYKVGNPDPLVDGGNISGATTGMLAFDPLAPSDAGNYYCIGSNGCGTDATNNATLTVMPLPEILAQPEDVCTNAGGTAILHAETGVGIVQYVWLKWDDGGEAWTLPSVGNESGIYTDTLTISPVEAANAARYMLWLKTAFPCEDFSDEAELQVGGCCGNAVAGDIDGDNDVDLEDFALFQACFGSGMGLVPGCECANMTSTDNDVDLSDYTLWVAELAGPS